MLKFRDFGIMKNEQNARILHDIWPKNTFPKFWEQNASMTLSPTPISVCVL